MVLTAGGGSNTPLPTTFKEFTIENILDKRWVIDWISYTFSDVEYVENKYGIEENGLSSMIEVLEIAETDKNDYILNSILSIMNVGKKWKAINIIDKAVNGYKFSWNIGEFIRINFAGPKMANGKPSTQILFSGQACREFESDFNASFYELFKFLKKEHKKLGFLFDKKGNHLIDCNGELMSYRFNGSFKRVDGAIDDFTGKELNIYDLESYATNYHWTGPYRSINLIHSTKIEHGIIQSKGYSLTFGSPGSSQLQIYDKKLEQIQKGESFIGSNTWYRYEMRFVDRKADAFIDEYIKAYEQNTLGELAFSVLKSQIRFLNPNFNDSRKCRWKTLPEWDNFLNHVQAINLKLADKPVRTIDTKLIWFDHSMVTTMTQLFLIYRNSPNQFTEEMERYIKKGSLKLTPEHLSALNKYLKDNGQPIITDEEYKKMTVKGIEI
ncbi:MAG: replication initiation factor domain-containing protein [Candidatus Muirbacterium halophilum]|nr:replication initiation factor domain-containing protein [Candidatus Muirbacterium halophilum]MCK9477458.1 replication initiation factor domain-containing protein [Candidatus Muirbacterium halophilum]